MGRWFVVLLLIVPLMTASGGVLARDGAGSLDARLAPRPVAAASADAISRPAWLRTVLPTAAVAYVRVPSPLGLIAAPDGSAFDTALRARPHVAAVEGIRDHLHGLLAGELSRSRLALVDVLVERMRSPLEMAVLLPEQGGATAARVLLSGVFDVDGPQSANRLLSQLTAASPMLRVEQSFTTDADAVVRVGPAVMRLRLMPASGRLVGLAALGAMPPDVFEAVVPGLEPQDEHPMREAESEIDSGHRGLFVWARVESLLPLFDGRLPPAGQAGLERLGLADARWLALGLGTRAAPVAEGRRRSHLRLAVAGPRTGLRRLVPAPANAFDLAAAGQPAWAASLALPDTATWRAIDGAIRNGLAGQPSELRGYQDVMQAFTEGLGVTPAQLLAALGPEVMTFADSAGQFAAVRVRDEAGWEAVREALVSRGGRSYRRHELGGSRYHELVLPSAWTASEQEALPVWARLLFGETTRVYWVRDGDYLVAAGTPQALIERQRYHRSTPLDGWLRRRQGQDFSQSVVAATVRLADSPRTVYRGYLLLLSQLGDMVGQPVDLFALPTATEAGLPAEGAYGFQIDNSGERLAAELSFEGHPLEIVTTGSYGTLATVGILSAVAIPAYRDYRQRAAVAEGLAATRAHRTAIGVFRAENGRYPDAGELAAMNLPPAGDGTAMAVDVEPGSGVVRLDFSALDAGEQRLLLEPRLAADGIRWRCGGTVRARNLPADCP